MNAGTTPLEALKAVISIAAIHSPEFSLTYFHAKAQRPVLLKLSAEDCSGKDVGKIGLLKKSMYEPETQQAIGEEIGKGILNVGVMSWGAIQETCPKTRKKKTSGLTHGDDFCGDRNEGELKK